MADEFPKLKRPSLILVTGLPFTEVGDVSELVIGWAKCPWLSHEIVLDSLSREAGYHMDNPPSEEEAARLLRVAFDVTCSSACFLLTHSSPNECVVISSNNLSYKSQLLGLLKIMHRQLSGDRGGRLLIIDCQKKNKFTWQRFADGLYQEPEWYWPKRWEDVEKAIQHHQQEGVDAYFITLRPPSPPPLVDAFKLVVDPVKDLLRDLDFSTSKPTLNRRSLFIEAIKDLLTYGDGSHVVDYPLWRRQRLEEQGRSFASRVTTQHHWCPRPGDCIFRLTHNLSHSQEEEEEEVHCELCDEKIQSKERAYYCQFCSLSFHQACCSAFPTLTAEELSQGLQFIKSRSDKLWRVLPTHACYSCIREGKGFSERCDSCVYRSTLKLKLLSPILRHSCDQHHILTMALSLADATSLAYVCRACGRFGYCCGYCCNVCSSDAYHMECLHLPLQMEHQHGGHLHRTNIEFSCTKEEEYEWCGACYKDIDPQTWAYSCQQCDYVAHLYCLFPFLSQRYPSLLGWDA